MKKALKNRTDAVIGHFLLYSSHDIYVRALCNFCKQKIFVAKDI